MHTPSAAAGSYVFRIEIERGGTRQVWALVAADLGAAARRAAELTAGTKDKVLALQPVGELL
jgi:hypothetical protein